MKSFSFISSRVTLLSSLKVCDLHHGKTYVFRVRAVNASGVGRPSDTSEPVLVEARPGETRLLSWQQAGPSGGVTWRRGQAGVWAGGREDGGTVVKGGGLIHVVEGVFRDTPHAPTPQAERGA